MCTSHERERETKLLKLLTAYGWGSRHTRLEPKENQQRPVNRTYYYVDFRATIDAVKYRMHKVVKDVERKMNKVCLRPRSPPSTLWLTNTRIGCRC